MKIKKIKYLLCAIAVIPIGFSLITKNPEGTSIEGEYHPTSSLEFLTDITYKKNGSTINEQSILAEELEMINQAQDFILLDLFLFNNAYNKSIAQYPNTVNQMAEALIAKKKAIPNIDIVFITDPINGFYGAYEQEDIANMKSAGILVIETDLNKLRNSNFLYSGYYRALVNPFGLSGKRWISNPLDKTQPDIHIRSVLKLANFKANHRKLIVTENYGLITTSNPHSASSSHSNTAVKFSGTVLNDIIEGEKAVAKFSGITIPDMKIMPLDKPQIQNTQVRYLTEKGIFNALIAAIDKAMAGDEIKIGIFYISDFDLVKALKSASDRGVKIKIIADPNKDAFGIKKDGSPNRTVLSQLVKKTDNINVRWYDTHGEQYHTKLAYFSYPDKNITIIGSANYTRRNLKDYNLESDLEIVTDKTSSFSADVNDYLDRLWHNIDGHYTADFDKYKESSIIKKILYYIQEFSGLSTY